MIDAVEITHQDLIDAKNEELKSFLAWLKQLHYRSEFDKSDFIFVEEKIKEIEGRLKNDWWFIENIKRNIFRKGYN